MIDGEVTLPYDSQTGLTSRHVHVDNMSTHNTVATINKLLALTQQTRLTVKEPAFLHTSYEQLGCRNLD